MSTAENAGAGNAAPSAPATEKLPLPTGGRKRRKTKRRKTHRKGKKSKKKRTKAGKTPTKKTRTSLNSPIVIRKASSLRHRSPSLTGSSITFRRRRR